METQIINNANEAIDFIIKNCGNQTEEHHINHIPSRIPHYPVNIAICGDEWTGKKFGRAKCRRDKNPQKIGGGGRNRSSNYAYQIWIWEV